MSLILIKCFVLPEYLAEVFMLLSGGRRRQSNDSLIFSWLFSCFEGFSQRCGMSNFTNDHFLGCSRCDSRLLGGAASWQNRDRGGLRRRKAPEVKPMQNTCWEEGCQRANAVPTLSPLGRAPVPSIAGESVRWKKKLFSDFGGTSVSFPRLLRDWLTDKGPNPIAFPQVVCLHCLG